MNISLKIHSDCIRCDNCRLICPVNAILAHQQHYFIENWSCSLCSLCIEICPTKSIKLHQDNSSA